jgi:hypothetical protein
MQEFAFIFRPTRAVSAADLPNRNNAARDWALARRKEGLLHNASPLEDGGVTVAAKAVTALTRDCAIGAVLVIAASDLDAAVALAKGHPGLAHGTEVDIRPVKAVALPPPSP